jgi:diguanylate cyclase (GGDEF)-like protein/hemerythrin-like metal-binding protein
LASDNEHTNRIADEAIRRMVALDLPHDPESFEFWFSYCAGYNRRLNAAVNELLAANPKPSLRDLRPLYERHLSSGRLVRQVDMIGRDLLARASDVARTIDEASGTTSDYGGELANSFKELRRTESLESLRATIAALLQSTVAVQRTNATLQEQLSESAQQVRLLHERLEAVQSESMLDALTGIASRRLFDMSLPRMIAQAEERHEPVSLLMIDVDDFKEFNDKYGHVVGDDVLRLAAAAIKQSCRSDDLVCRYGGDEFVVILPRTPIERALPLAEKIRVNVMQRELVRRSTGEKLGWLTVSIGVSQHQRGRPSESLVERADEWLYAAKQSGRNRIATIQPGHDEKDDADDGHPRHGLVWRKVYECGNADIDREHRELFELANVLFDPTIAPESSSRDFGTAIDRLLAHVTRHFANEEVILNAHGYRRLSGHQSVHARLLADAGQLKAAALSGEKTVGDLREFIINQVVAEHVFKSDRDYFSLFG